MLAQSKRPWLGIEENRPSKMGKAPRLGEYKRSQAML